MPFFKRRHTPDREGFIEVARTRDLRPGQLLCLEVSGVPIALGLIDGRIVAFDDVCPHAGGSLCAGRLEHHIVECPEHGWRFDLLTGQAEPPAEEDLSLVRHEVKLIGDKIWIRIE